MHLLAAEPGTISDGSEAVDLGQTPGDIVVLASADTEIALLAAAQSRRGGGPSLRLAPVMRLGHHLSVDLYMAVVAQAKLVVARLLGGSAWSRPAASAASRWPCCPATTAPTPSSPRCRARRRRPAGGCGATWPRAGRAMPT